MNCEKNIFIKLFKIIYWYYFNLCEKRYGSICSVNSFTCRKQLLEKNFTTFSYLDSLRYIEYCLESIAKVGL